MYFLLSKLTAAHIFTMPFTIAYSLHMQLCTTLQLPGRWRPARVRLQFKSGE